MQDDELLDLVGIGFGPVGIALAAAIEEQGESDGLRLSRWVSFFESGSGSGWQTGLLLRNADIQHHFLRDLATPRNPRSRFTFANYLKEHDRLFEFGSLVYGASGGTVSRIEWSDYVAWAARLLNDYVVYNTPVETIRLDRCDGRDILRVVTPHGEVSTRAVAYCASQKPQVPPIFEEHLGSHVFHATRFLDMMERFDPALPIRVCVVGAGQTAAEVVLYLHSTFPQAQITCLQRTVGFELGDCCPFVDRMFRSKEADFFFALAPGSKRDLLDEVARANYAAVDRDVASALYRRDYEDRLLGAPRIRTLFGTEATTVHRDEAEFIIETAGQFDHSIGAVNADVVILCTGLIERMLPKVFDDLRPAIQLWPDGSPVASHDYSLQLRHPSDVSVFVPGAGEPSTGLGSSDFNMIAMNAWRVARALRAKGLLMRRVDAPALEPRNTPNTDSPSPRIHEEAVSRRSAEMRYSPAFSFHP
jgi:L-ornithine N5-oxygenase